jgi:formylglycine-generating enzyme required for sulfatase activity
VKIIIPLFFFFFLFCLSFYYFTSTKPPESENNIKMRFKGKEQKTDQKFEKSNRVEVDGVFFDMIEIPSGESTLGALNTDTQSLFDEMSHRAFFNESFLLSQTEVTVAQWNAVLKQEGESNALPKTSITWMEAIRFCNALSKTMGKPEAYNIDGNTVTWKSGIRGYRLPTEAEWEYAARGKSSFLYAGSDLSDGVSWSVVNSKGKIQQVATKNPNTFSVHDMSGNVAEWVWDWYSCPTKGSTCPDPYPKEVTSASRGAPTGTHRVIRGGSVADARSRLRISSRDIMNPTNTSPYVGFRIAY